MSGIRHNSRAMHLARTLKEGGWSYGSIQDHLEADFGVRPSRATLRRWCDAEYAERRREQNRRDMHERRAAESSFRLMGSSPDYRAAFVLRLRHEGVRDIQEVCRVVFGEQVDEVLIPTKEAVRRLGLSARAFENWRERGLITPAVIGKPNLYDPRDVDALMAQKYRKVDTRGAVAA